MQLLLFIFISVLSDTNKRYIYDVYGKTGLDADWQVCVGNINRIVI